MVEHSISEVVRQFQAYLEETRSDTMSETVRQLRTDLEGFPQDTISEMATPLRAYLEGYPPEAVALAIRLWDRGEAVRTLLCGPGGYMSWTDRQSRREEMLKYSVEVQQLKFEARAFDLYAKAYARAARQSEHAAQMWQSKGEEYKNDTNKAYEQAAREYKMSAWLRTWAAQARHDAEQAGIHRVIAEEEFTSWRETVVQGCTKKERDVWYTSRETGRAAREKEWKGRQKWVDEGSTIGPEGTKGPGPSNSSQP